MSLLHLTVLLAFPFLGTSNAFLTNRDEENLGVSSTSLL